MFFVLFYYFCLFASSIWRKKSDIKHRNLLSWPKYDAKITSGGIKLHNGIHNNDVYIYRLTAYELEIGRHRVYGAACMHRLIPAI